MRRLSGEDEKIALEYMAEAAKVALNSTCHDSRCGSIIVKYGEIIGKGFNSPPGNKENQRRCDYSKDSYHKKITDKTCCVHAEERAIIDALCNNQLKIVGSSLYFTRIDGDGNLLKLGNPYCTICSKMALDVGIEEFILYHSEGISIYNTDEYNSISFNYR
nr:hypothetical protein [Candidatus Woesearchaeota archaeon]